MADVREGQQEEKFLTFVASVVFEINAIHISIEIVPGKGASTSGFDMLISFWFGLLVVPGGNTFVSHKVSVISFIRRAETSERYISLNTPSMEDSLRWSLSIIAVLKRARGVLGLSVSFCLQ